MVPTQEEKQIFKEDRDDPDVMVPFVINYRKIKHCSIWAKRNEQKLLEEREKFFAYNY
jgi:hypothetical protein